MDGYSWFKLGFLIFSIILLASFRVNTIVAVEESLEVDIPKVEKRLVRGYVDRIENENQAVILIEELNEEKILDRNDFEISIVPSTWINIVLKNGEIVDAWVLQNKTSAEKERVKELIEELRTKDKNAP